MIKRFKKLFQGQSEFQSFLTKSSLTKDNYVYKQEDVEILIPYLTEDQNIIEFFQVYQEESCQLYTIKMKMLITIHQMLNISDEFASYFTKINFAYFNKPSHKPETFVFKQVTNEVWLLENLQIPFLQYLQKLALNVQEIKSYRNHHFRKPIHQSKEDVKQNKYYYGIQTINQIKFFYLHKHPNMQVFFMTSNFSDLNQLLKIYMLQIFNLQLLINFSARSIKRRILFKSCSRMLQIAKPMPQLKTSLSNFPHDFLLKKLASNLYCELRQFQRQLINSLSALLDTNSRASNIEIFEFFREVQIIEKKTMSYYMLHKLFDPGRKLMPPLQLKIDLKSAKHLEQQALNEQLKINQQKQMRSQRNSRSNSLDQQQRVSQGFISQRERRFMMYSRTKKQDTIQEDIEMPTEEQQPSEKKKITQMMDNQVNDIPKQFDNLENDNSDIQKKESSDESEINERNSQKETNDIVKNQESTSQADQDENQYI